MTTDAEREAFEAWFSQIFWIHFNKCEAWTTWCARARLQSTKPEPVADDLVERLSNMAPEADDMPRTREVMLKAAARITSDAATIAAKDAEIERLSKAARKAHDGLEEINTNRYDHDDVCRLNEASVNAILTLADALGETHGYDEKWWAERRAETAESRITELQAEVERLRGALQPIVEEFGSTIALYHKIGPDYTLKDGTEVFEVSSILDRSDLIDAALAAINTGESDAG